MLERSRGVGCRRIKWDCEGRLRSNSRSGDGGEGVEGARGGGA